MATRSAIAVQTPHGLRAVYCHWDGYPSHHLPILSSHYPTAKAAAALILPGDISVLRTEEIWGSDYQRDGNGRALFDQPRLPRRDPQPLYYRERGDSNVGPRSFADVGELTRWADGSGCEHVYVFRPGSGWEHTAIAHEIADAIAPGCDRSQW